MRLKFDARARAILRRLPAVNVYSAAELVLLAGLAVQCARLLWVVVTPVSPLGAWAPAGPALPADPAAVFAAFDPFYRVSGAARGPAVVTALQVTLFGTRMDSAQGRGSAILAGPDGVQRSVSVGEEVAPGVILKAVAFDHVTLDRGGAAEDLFLDQSGAAATGAPSPPPGREVSPGAPPDAAAGPPSAPAAPPPAGPVAPGNMLSSERLRGDIGAIPRIEGGRVNGVTVRGQGQGAFRAAGLRDGDVITRIDGRPVAAAADLERLARAGAGRGTLSMTVERDGQSLPLTIPVSR